MGFNRVEMCTGPVVPRDGNLTVGSGISVLLILVLVAGIGICTGAIGALVMIA